MRVLGHCLDNDAWNKRKPVLPNLGEIEFFFFFARVKKNRKWERRLVTTRASKVRVTLCNKLGNRYALEFDTCVS
jgi:hypothetical protein